MLEPIGPQNVLPITLRTSATAVSARPKTESTVIAATENATQLTGMNVMGAFSVAAGGVATNFVTAKAHPLPMDWHRM